MAESEYWALTNPLFSSALPSQNPDRPPISIPSQFVLPLLKRHITAKPAAAAAPHVLGDDAPSSSLPVIDLSQYDDSMSFQLHHACADWGVFQIVNHGVPHAVLQELRTQIDLFLDLPFADRCPRPLGNFGQGYGTGFVRGSVGVTEWRDYLRLFTFPSSLRDYSAWPLNLQFRKAIEDFADQMRGLQQRLMSSLSQNLGLSARRLQEIVGEMHQMILINHYPPCPKPELAAGVDQHADVGALTCLWQQNEVVGLQVFHNGAWIPVEPIPGGLIVLVGDQIQIASNGIYKSVVHRGVVNATKRRVSVSSFYQLRAEQVVEPAVELTNAQNPPLYKATCFADHDAKVKRVR